MGRRVSLCMWFEENCYYDLTAAVDVIPVVYTFQCLEDLLTVECLGSRILGNWCGCWLGACADESRGQGSKGKACIYDPPWCRSGEHCSGPRLPPSKSSLHLCDRQVPELVYLFRHLGTPIKVTCGALLFPLSKFMFQNTTLKTGGPYSICLSLWHLNACYILENSDNPALERPIKPSISIHQGQSDHG
jgi:hypothetical protein